MENLGEDTDTRECEAMRKVFVGGLNRQTDDDSFFEYFSQFGNTIDKVIIRDNQSGQSKGFGFITFDCSDAVENCFKSRPHVLDNKTLDVKRAMPRDINTAAAHQRVTKLFIGGVGDDISEEQIKDYITERHASSGGTIDKIDLVKDKETGKNKGFGFIECSDTDFADRLVISEANFKLGGKELRIKKSDSKYTKNIFSIRNMDVLKLMNKKITPLHTFSEII